MDYVSRPEVREAALRAELGGLLNSIDRPAKARRIAEVRAQLGETEHETDDTADDSASDEGDGAPRARRAPAKKAAS